MSADWNKDDYRALQDQLKKIHDIQTEVDRARRDYAEACARLQLPRLTPDVMTAFEAWVQAEKTIGELDSEHHPTAWKALKTLGHLIDPSNPRYFPSEEEE